MTAPIPKSRLGRGLASLIGEPSVAQTRLPPEGEQRMIALDQLKGGKFNPRKDFREDELAELADSIRVKGLVQPILARPDGQGYEIVAGERRWRAAQRAGLHMVPVIVRELDDREVLELAIIENVQRSDLNAIEEAGGYRDLVERFAYSQEQLAEIIGKSRSHVANTMRLLKLPEGVQALVQAIDGGADTAGGPRKVREKDADTKAFEKDLADALGLKVEIKRGSGESGNLIIRYGNFDQLDYIKMRLTGMGG